MMKARSLLLLATMIAATACSNRKAGETTAAHPNIVIIYVDDLGYADVGCYGAVGVQTPNIDRLAAEGVRFTDGHCAAATCTPSRFALLTGSYAFRNEAAILPGDAPLLIRPGTGTVAGMLQKAGYATAVVGKWHLGLGSGDLDWNEEIRPGPLEIGFDYCFLIPATGDRVPCVYVENHRVVGLDPDDPIEVSYRQPLGDEPTGVSNPEMLKMEADLQHSGVIKDNVSRIGYMTGGTQARWRDEEFPDILTGKAIRFMEKNKDQPFFLYFSFHDIHVPRVPNRRFAGESAMGPRGDAIVQMDWCTGEIVRALERLGVADNTLVIFTSDNGPILDDGYADQAVELLGDHNPSGPFRGAKYSIYEAGTRVPTITWWPGTINPGISDAMVTQVDLYASLAALTGQDLDPGAAPDSHAMIDVWMGHSKEGRTTMVEEAFTLALRQDQWKYIRPVKGEIPGWFEMKKVESGLSHEPQLYHLGRDRAEQHNLAEENPDRVRSMSQTLQEIIKNGGSRPGWSPPEGH